MLFNKISDLENIDKIKKAIEIIKQKGVGDIFHYYKLENKEITIGLKEFYLFFNKYKDRILK